MQKLQRNYRLIIQTTASDEALIIEPPFTIRFNIMRATMATANSMSLEIYNLSQNSRDKIFQDRFNPREYKRVILQAGYGENLTTVFSGNMFQSRHQRSNADIITYIEARDGGFDINNSITNLTIAEGATTQEVIRQLAQGFDNVTIGNITSLPDINRRPTVLDGNTFELINRYAKGRAFIDLEQINVLRENDVFDSTVPLINQDSGLLGTPKREDSYITIETLFEPRIQIGQVIEIESSVNPVFDGQYKVIGLTHSATISESVGGDAKSSFNLLVGSQLFGGFNRV